jgi:hypothetical protein
MPAHLFLWNPLGRVPSESGVLLRPREHTDEALVEP